MNGLEWAETVRRSFKADTPQEWLSSVGVEEDKYEEAKVPFIYTNPDWKKAPHDHLSALVKWKVFEMIVSAESNRIQKYNGWISYVCYFGVPKGIQPVMRAITSAKELNQRVGKPPGFRMITHEVLVFLISQFPHAKLATSDYRNHFYQFKLPDGARGMFVVHCGGDEYVMIDVPMGFSWSPYWAQSFTSVVLYSARKRWAEDPKVNAGEQPPIPAKVFDQYITYTMKGETVAFVCAIYDNVLIIAKDIDTRDKIKKHINAANNHFQLRVKFPCEGADDKGWFHNDTIIEAPAGQVIVETRAERGKRDRDDDPLIATESYTSLTFMGVDYIKGMIPEPVLIFRHCLENAQIWRDEFLELLADMRERAAANPSEGEYLESIDCAEMIGVLIWDVRTFFLPMSKLGAELSIMSAIGKEMVKHNNWETRAPITDKQGKALLKTYQAFIDRTLIDRYSMIHRPRLERRTHVIVLTSDSSGPQASGLWLKDTGDNWEVSKTLPDLEVREELVHIVWKDWINPSDDNRFLVRRNYETKDINWKEAMVAILTIRAALATIPIEERADCVIVFGEDNEAAKSALNGFYYPKEPGVCGELFLLYEELQGVDLVSFYTRSEDMSADEPSRGKPIIKKKCFDHFQELRKSYKDFGGNAF